MSLPMKDWNIDMAHKMIRIASVYHIVIYNPNYMYTCICTESRVTFPRRIDTLSVLFS